MAEKKYVQIGYTKKTHGLQGELKVSVEAQLLEDFLKTEVIFLDLKSGKTPFFIESIREGNDLIVKFEEVDGQTAAQNLTGKAMFLRESDILEDEERELELPDAGFQFCKNFKMVDATLGEVGEISEVLQMPAQEMAVLRRGDGREIYVPLIPQFIEKVDKRGRKIMVNLPDGLLDM